MPALEIDNSLCPNRKRSIYLHRYLVSFLVSYFKPNILEPLLQKNGYFLPHSEMKNLQQCLMAALNANKRIMASHENLSRLEKKKKGKKKIGGQRRSNYNGRTVENCRTLSESLESAKDSMNF